jgi:nuclear transport factor 2 (NTF2) superfamily protein
MPDDVTLIRRLYESFNARDMEAALAAMHPDVVWANGMEGGYVHRREGVRDYWSRQWATVESHALPVKFSTAAEGNVEVEVHLTARDHQGNVVFDRMGTHSFHVVDGLVRRFDIR